MRALQDKKRSRFASYLMLALGIPLLLLVASCWAAATNWFFDHDDYFMLRNIGYSLTLKHADCQVVLTGDSSALTGLDPEPITKLTGLSACNVAEGGTVTVVTGSYPLDTYLQNNARPKYLVFMFTPSLIRPDHSWRDESSYYEGIVYRLHFQRNRETMTQFVSHPIEMLSFSIWAAHGIVADAMERMTNPHRYDGVEDPAVRRQKHNGLFTFYSSPETRCFRNGWDKSPHIFVDKGWVEGLRRRYGVGGTHVIVNVAPVADCDDMKDVYERDLMGVHDNPLEVFPIGMFNSQDVHFTPDGAERISTGVAGQILVDEQRNRQ